MNHFGDLWHRMERLVHMSNHARREGERKLREAVVNIDRHRDAYLALHQDISVAVPPAQEEHARRMLLASTEELLDQVQSLHSVLHRCHQDACALQKTIHQLRDDDDE